MKRVTLNTNSWHFKYYSALVSDTPPKTLCPYFWMMALLILISPLIGIAYVLFHGLKVVTNFFDRILPKKAKKPQPRKTYDDLIKELDEHSAKMERRRSRMDKLSNYFSKFIKWVFLPLIGLFVILEIYDAGTKFGWLSILIKFAVAILLTIIFFGFLYFILEIVPRFSSKLAKPLRAINPLNWKITSIIGHMIKAWYTKACPLITWDGENKKDIEEVNAY